MQDVQKRNLVIGVAGGSGSGKSTFCDQLSTQIGSESVARLSHDDYYHDLSHLEPHERARVNFDSPDSLESNLLVEHLTRLSVGASVDAPTYDFARHVRRVETRRVEARPVIIAEGILLLSNTHVRTACDVMIFIHAEDEVRFQRRLDRDVEQRGRSADSVRIQWETTVQPMFEQHVAPSREHANLIVPMNRANQAALDLVSSYVLHKLAHQ